MLHGNFLPDNLALNFWVIYEKDFAEVSNRKAPGELNIPLELF
jgi:hypothetical protein